MTNKDEYIKQLLARRAELQVQILTLNNEINLINDISAALAAGTPLFKHEKEYIHNKL